MSAEIARKTEAEIVRMFQKHGGWLPLRLVHQYLSRVRSAGDHVEQKEGRAAHPPRVPDYVT